MLLFEGNMDCNLRALVEGAIHNYAEKNLNGGFILRTHQLFSEEFKNAAIAGHVE